MSETEVENKRRYIRQEIQHVTIDINNGKRLFHECEVKNVSSGGLLVGGIAKQILKGLSADQEPMYATINYGTNTCRIDITPRWFATDGVHVLVGFEVVNQTSN